MQTDVTVVGGGPCGLMTALLLGRLGVDTVLVEKHPHLLEHPKAMGITRRTGEIFRQLGLLDAMLAGGLASSPDAISQWLKDGLQGEILGRAPAPQEDDDISPCHPFHCPQPHVERVLREALTQHTHVKCLFGASCEEVSQDADGVMMRVVTDDKGQTIQSKFVVAADGDHSPIREALGIQREGPGELGRFLSVYFRANYRPFLHGRLALLTNLLGEDFFEIFVTVNGKDQWLMHHYLDHDETPAMYPEPRLRQMIINASGLPQVPVEVLSTNPWAMTPAIAKEWRRGRVFLVGDAAARVSPAGGLGMNNGLQSAHNLAWKLADVIRGERPDSFLDSYEAERRPAAGFTFENSNQNALEVMDIVKAAFSGAWAKAMTQIEQSRRAGHGWGQDFGIVYQSDALIPDGTSPAWPADRVNDYIAQGRPGHRAPSFTIKIGNNTLPSLDLLGYHHTVLLAADADVATLSACSPNAKVLLEGRDFTPESSNWKQRFGISAKGGVWIRPDGYIGARAH